MDQAQLVVVVMGASEGVVFEYEQLATRRAVEKVVLVIPPYDRQQLQESWDRFVRHALGGLAVAPPDLDATLVASFPRQRAPMYLIHPARRPAADHYSLAVQLALHHRSGQ
jgi:hypothetical protein